MKITPTAIEGVVIIEPQIFGDERGYFFESFSQEKFNKEIAPVNFVQDNESFSRYGVLRGLHFQKGDAAQAKLVRVVGGEIMDVAVDLRNESATYGQSVAVFLSGDNKKQLFIPRGFAHGFVVLSQEVLFQYKCDNYYNPLQEGGVRFDDPVLNIDWQLPKPDLTLSDKDKVLPFLSELESSLF